MADQYYENLWDEALIEVQELFENDKKFLSTTVFPERDQAYEIMKNNYIMYIGVIKKLGECYSEIIQPQERPVIKNLLDSSVGRLLEIKKELVDVQKTDFLYMDNILIRSKKTVADFEIVVPEYYRNERIDKLKEIDSFIKEGLKMKEKRLAEAELAEILAAEAEVRESKEDEVPAEESNINETPNDVVESKRPAAFKKEEKSEEELAFEAAVLLLQKHERARIARLRTQLTKEKNRLMDDIAWLRHKPIPEDVKLKLFKMIKRYWERYKRRRHQTFRAVSRNIVMGLLEPRWKPRNELREQLEKLHEDRRKAQNEAWQAMEDAAVAARIRFERNSDRICDDIADELRYFIYTWYTYMKDAGYPMLPEWPNPTPVLPTSSVFGIPKGAPQALVDNLIKNVVNTIAGKEIEPLGGSALIVAGHWIPVEAYALIIEQMAKSKNKGKNKDKAKADKEKEKEKKKKEKLAEAKRLKELKKQGFVPTQSKFIETLEGGIDDYHVDWENREIKRGHNQNMIDSEVAKKLHLELRAKVDETMILELERLQEAINRDRNIKTKKKKDKKNKGKKGKGKGKAGKRKKDLTEGKTEQELLTDLASHDLVTSYNKKFFIDIPGAPSLVNYERRNVFNEDPPPQWGDFKQVIKEYCVLSLGSTLVHEKAPLIRSVLICGPMMVIEQYADVICTESGAVKFILDPFKMPLKEYPKKMFEHLMNKVPRLSKPSIIFVPGAEKVFYKKVPKEEKKMNPKALAKVLPKLIKSIKPGDQLLVLGISDQPWAANANKMTKIFDKVICFPECDFQTLNTFWINKLSSYHHVDKYIDAPTLTTMTMGYGLKDLEDKLNNVMKTERIIQLKLKPLQVGEICMDLPKVETKGKGKKAAKQNPWDWSQKSVKMYKQRHAQLLEATQKDKGKKGPKEDSKPKEKKKEIPEKLVMSNSFISRAVDRPVKSCGPWAPEREIECVKDYYGLTSIQPNLNKFDLYRNEKSLPQFPIRRPNI